MNYVVFGAGLNAKYVIKNIQRMYANNNIYLVDNFNYDFQYDAFGELYPVYHSSKLLEEDVEKMFIIISSLQNHDQIARQLRNMGFMEGKHFFGGPRFIQGHWKETGGLHPVMYIRVKLMSELISSESESVLDVGCGNMYLKHCLKKGVKYIPCDYIAHDETTIVCDLNKREYPEIHTDTVFLSGILEHIEDSKEFLNHICLCAKKEVILSYNTIEYRPNYEDRFRSGILNHFDIYDLVELFKVRNMYLQESKHLEYPPQSLFKFVRR